MIFEYQPLNKAFFSLAAGTVENSDIIFSKQKRDINEWSSAVVRTCPRFQSKIAYLQSLKAHQTTRPLSGFTTSTEMFPPQIFTVSGPNLAAGT